MMAEEFGAGEREKLGVHLLGLFYPYIFVFSKSNGALARKSFHSKYF